MVSVIVDLVEVVVEVLLVAREVRGCFWAVGTLDRSAGRGLECWKGVVSKVPEVSVATPAEPRCDKTTFLVQILGGKKLLKFVEKCQ